MRKKYEFQAALQLFLFRLSFSLCCPGSARNFFPSFNCWNWVFLAMNEKSCQRELKKYLFALVCCSLNGLFYIYQKHCTKTFFYCHFTQPFFLQKTFCPIVSAHHCSERMLKKKRKKSFNVDENSFYLFKLSWI